jgi:hypothetical protein
MPLAADHQVVVDGDAGRRQRLIMATMLRERLDSG